MSAAAADPVVTAEVPAEIEGGGFRLTPAVVIVGTYLMLLVIACAGASLIAPDDPAAQDLGAVLKGPSGAHWLGTDTLGRDVLSRLLHGGQRSFLSVAEGLAVVLALGVPLGVVAGYRGGVVDRLVSGVSEVLMAIPAIVLILVVLAVRPHDEDAAMLVFGLLGVPTVLRVVRGVTLRVREEQFVEASRVAGVVHRRIILRHIVPHARGPIVVQASLFCAYALIFETGLAFLGLTGGGTTPSWGGMVGEASTVIEQQRWLLFPAGGAIASTVLALGILGDAVRDAAVGGQPKRRPAAGSRRRPVRPPSASTPSASRASDALLQVDGLTIAATSRAATTLVEDVSFSVAPGETVGLVGESGCGKSVTALGVLRLLPPSLEVERGHVWFDGQDLAELDDRSFARLRGAGLGYVSQEPQTALDPTFSVGSQLREVVRRHDGGSRSEVQARVLELLGLVGLPDPERVAASHPHELSGGMAQRCAIALALAGRPRMLIADEPTTALDVTVQAEILGLLRELQRVTGMAILVITHDWGVVADLCDRTLVMYAGQLIEEAEVQELFDQPLHPYTLGLLASHPSLAEAGQPMAALPGRVPPPGHWPSGCRFADRCAFAADICRQGAPPLLRPSADRGTRCIRVGDVIGKVEVG